MKAAIYARYSSDNQREQSIHDQIRVCQNYARDKGLEVSNDHIYSDEARSGAIRDRAGLDALLEACGEKKFQVVLVDDSSRLSRDVSYFNQLLCRFIYMQVRLVSVSDGLDTSEENAKVAYQFRSIFNELYLSDLKKKTHRGQMGQLMRGYVMGGIYYGYESVPMGELRHDKKGRLKADGYTLKIIPEEARIIKRIYSEFTDGKSINYIMRSLNEENIPIRQRRSGGWSAPTLSRMLRNEIYKGTYIWNRTKSIKDPMSGNTKQIPRPKSEWVIVEKPELKIVEPELWDKAHKRLEEMKEAYSRKKGSRRKSYVETNPTHLLSGNLVCGVCKGAVILVSGKGAGYYGCHNAKRKICDNKLLISRKKLESFFMQALLEKVLKAEHLQLIYKKIEEEIKKQFAHLPEEIRLKKRELERLETRIHRFIEFIAGARGTPSIAAALEDAESKAEPLKTEIESLEKTQGEAFEPPPKEWIVHRIGNIQEVLERKTEKSALLLRDLTGKIVLTPAIPDVGKPYYRAKSKLKSFAVLNGAKGSNSLQWWTRLGSNQRPHHCQRRALPTELRAPLTKIVIHSKTSKIK